MNGSQEQHSPPNLIKPPVIVFNEDGSASWYPEVEGQEGFLVPIGGMESPEIEDGLYAAYDSEGRLLRVKVVERIVSKAIFRWTYRESVAWVAVELAEPDPRHADDLRNKLAYYFSWSGVSEAEYKKMPLPDLIARLMEGQKASVG
jgi:hypothetical protein